MCYKGAFCRPSVWKQVTNFAYSYFAVLAKNPVLPEQISNAQSESVLTVLTGQMGSWNRML